MPGRRCNILIKGGVMRIVTAFMITALCVVANPAYSAEDIEVMWLGNATTRIVSVAGKIIVIDPFVTQNPKTPRKFKKLEAFGKVELILITHGHGDHVRDLKELAKLTGATVVANYEYGRMLADYGVVDSEKVIAMNKGGTVSPLGRDIKIHMVPAEHSSSFDMKHFGLKPDLPRYRDGGAAVGYVIELENGFTIYHSGDTGIFGDMALIHTLFEPDLALVYIAGHFGMGPELAAYAVKNLIKPKIAIPIHYGTFPIINVDPARFAKAMEGSDITARVVEPGEPMKY